MLQVVSFFKQSTVFKWASHVALWSLTFRIGKASLGAASPLRGQLLWISLLWDLRLAWPRVGPRALPDAKDFVQNEIGQEPCADPVLATRPPVAPCRVLGCWASSMNKSLASSQTQFPFCVPLLNGPILGWDSV